MRTIALFFALLSSAQAAPPMQHGFILGEKSRLATHLVARGHHSRQTIIIGGLGMSPEALEIYKSQRELSAGQTYFLFQAQDLDLEALKAGDALQGHIIESPLGGYDPGNVIVEDATFLVQEVLLNLPNPFFRN